MKRAIPGRTGTIRKQTASSRSYAGNPPTPEKVAEIWRHCHAMLDLATPLVTDCGRLCAARCCTGGPEDGMLLFPGEELLFTGVELLFTGVELSAPSEVPLSQADGSLSDRNLPSNWRLLDSSIFLPDIPSPVKLLVCDGRCIRTRRPFSCRIFPLLPWEDRSGRIRVRPDLRAAASCPLLSDDSLPPIRQDFAEAVCEAFALVITLPGVRALLDLLNEETDVLRKFYGIPH